MTITLKQGTFSNGQKTVTLTGHRVGAYIANAGGDAQGALQCRIYGLPKDMLTKLTAIGIIATENIGNLILIEAGTEDKDGKRTKNSVFKGWIYQSWADFSQQPEVALNVVAYGAYGLAMTAVPAVSYSGSVDVVQAMQSLADKAGLTLVNKGVYGNISPQLTDTVLDGSLFDQIIKLAHDANIQQTIEDDKLIIWPQNTYIDDQEIPIISPDTGLIGYPTFSSSEMIFTCLYNKSLKLGRLIQVKSSLEQATGFWRVIRVTHALESENTSGNGAWFTTLYCARGGK